MRLQELYSHSPGTAESFQGVPGSSAAWSEKQGLFLGTKDRKMELFGLGKPSEITELNCTPALVRPPLNHVSTFTWLLNPSRDGNSSAVPGSLFQCLSALLRKNFFLIPSLNLLSLF